jgi:hypothetical protein
MTYLLIIIALSQGVPPAEYRYPMADRDTCMAAIMSATYSKSPINTAFYAFCVPQPEAKG